MFVNAHTYIHTYIHACMHTYVHAYIHTCIYIYICIYPLYTYMYDMCKFMPMRDEALVRALASVFRGGAGSWLGPHGLRWDLQNPS